MDTLQWASIVGRTAETPCEARSSAPATHFSLHSFPSSLLPNEIRFSFRPLNEKSPSFIGFCFCQSRGCPGLAMVFMGLACESGYFFGVASSICLRSSFSAL